MRFSSPEVRAWELFTMLTGTTSGQEGAMYSSVLQAAWSQPAITALASLDRTRQAGATSQ